mgnify:CR=1 FL=1
MRVLHLAHNHPDYHAGGTEIFAKALCDSQNAETGWRAWFAGAALPHYRSPNAGTPFVADDRGRGDAVVTANGFERLILSQRDARGVLHPFADLVEGVQPDVVHIHHFLLLGMEILAVIRRAAPRAAIVVTLHDYYLICHNDGLMIRTESQALCDVQTPQRCAACFPEVGLTNFRLRETFIKHALQQVDAFAAPSAFLRHRFAAWGVAPERIRHIPNGYPRTGGEPAKPAPRPRGDDAPVVFGFFGHLNAAKGAPVALRAARRLVDAGDTNFRLRLHGSDRYASEAVQAEIGEHIDALGGLVERDGPYARGEIAAGMAGVDWVLVPSIWWENDPLVVDEAFLNGRPVICSGLGGLAEKVTHLENGLHVRPNDPRALAAAMADALSGRIDAAALVRGAPEVASMSACAEAYRELYDQAVAGRVDAAA